MSTYRILHIPSGEMVILDLDLNDMSNFEVLLLTVCNKCHCPQSINIFASCLNCPWYCHSNHEVIEAEYLIEEI